MVALYKDPEGEVVMRPSSMESASSLAEGIQISDQTYRLINESDKDEGIHQLKKRIEELQNQLKATGK